MPATEKSNAYDVAVNGADVYVVGNWTGTIDFDPGAGVQNVASVGGNDIYLLKLDTSLTYQSHVAYGGTLSATDEYGGRVFVNRSREIVMGNLYNSDIPDINPGAGTAAVTLNGGQDGLVVKYYECGVNPVITKQPLIQTICEGTTLVLSVEAPGTAATFQWRKNGNNISGANSSVLTIPGFPATEAGNYSVVVGNLCNSATLTSSTVVVTVTETPTPTGSAAQTLCNSATVASLVATGTSVKWYSTASGGTALLGTAALVNGNTYYATQTLNGCESANRLAVAVTINAPPAPTGTSNQAFCNGATLASFVLTGTNLKFYTTNTGGTALPNTTLIVNNQSYWASQTVNGCESATRFAVGAAITSVAAPTGAAIQNFCGAPTVANLVATGASIKWYTTVTGGTPLVSTTPLVNGTIYYATQTGANNCESFNRTGVTANIFSCENGLNFDGTNDQVTLPPTINSFNSSAVSTTGTLEAWIRTSNAGSGFRALVVRNNYYGLFLVDNKLTSYNWSVNGSTGATTFNGATLNDNQWHHVALTFQIGVTNGTQLYLDGQPVGTPITQFLNNQSANFALGSNANTQYYGGLMDRVKIWARVLTPQEINDSYNCIAVTNTNLITNYNFNQGFPAQNNAGVTTLTDEAGTADNGTLTGFALTGTTSNWANGYTCTPILCPTPTGVASQAFCNGATVANLVANGTNIQWYAASTGGSPLSTSAALTNGAIYYATQTVNGCESAIRLAVTVTINAAPNAVIAPATVSICSGQSTSLTASGGGTYTWSNSGGSNAVATFSPNTNTTYTVTVTGANGCTAIASRLVSVNAIPTTAISPATVTICNGQSTTLTASGGGTYAWSNSGGSNATATFSPTTNTTYTVTVTGANSCTATVSRLVTVNSNPTANVQPATVTICSGQSATLTASGGGTYAWSNSGGSNAQATFSPTTNTTYTVTVTGANSCTAIASGLVTVNAVPTASISPATVSICSGQSTTLTANGGGTYAWSNSGGSNAVATFSPTTNTTYTVTVTGANSCTSTASRLVTVNTNPVAAISPSTVTICDGQSATLTASGGSSYTWSNSGGSNAQATFSPTTTTTYTVTVVDGNLCSATASRLVTVNPIPTATINGPTTICSGLSATLIASGGGTYAWNNNGGNTAQATFTPTQTTTYTVTVTGTGNCTATASQIVSVQTVPTATISGPTTVCLGDSITLTANGGNAYRWSNGFQTPVIKVAPIANTTYIVTVSISANCTATASQSVTVNIKPSASINPTNVTICEGVLTTLTASGGGTYAWSNSGGSNAQATFSPTTNTTYTVTVTGANSCTAIASGLVTVNAVPTASISPATVSICSGQSTTLTANGGGTYAWSNSGGSNAVATFSPTTNTTYTVTVTGANSCTSTASRLVTVNTNPVAAISPSTVTICDGQSATLTASGGSSYTWSNSGGSNAQATFSPTTTTTYTVTVVDGNLCSATASRLVTVNPIPTATINGPTTICSGLSATLIASGGGTYAWNNNGGNTAQATFTPTQTTTYTVTVTGTGNCTATASQIVSVQNAPTATIIGNTIICNGETTKLTANGGNTYVWNNGATASEIIVSPTNNTTYSVTISIGTNCTASESITVDVNQPSAITQLSETICQGSSYVFDGNILIQSNTYIDTFTNTAGCDSIVQLTLIVTPAPVTRLDTLVCDGLTINFFNQIITRAGVYSETLQTLAGCDSIVELNVNYLNPITTTSDAQICIGQTYEFDGQQLSQSNTYTATFVSAQGCDSTVTLNLSVVTEITETVNASICEGDSYTFDGQQLNIADNYVATFLSLGGCDSVVTLKLIVNDLPQPTVTSNNANLSTESFATYQWLFNGNDIQGADQQNYIATQNGDYSVKVTDANGCENISDAVNVTIVGVMNYDLGFMIYPNPTSGIINIETAINHAEINIITLEGKLVFRQKANNNTTTIDVSTLAHGMYIIEMKANEAISRVRVVKE